MKNIIKHLKSQRGMVPLVEILVLALVLAAGAAVYVRVQNSNKSAKVVDSGGVKKKAKPMVKPVDPTANWTAYSSKTGQFSLRYKPGWKADICEDHDEILYIGPSSKASVICNSEKGSQILVSSMAGDHRADYETESEFVGSKTSQAVTINGVTGKRITGTTIKNEDAPGASMVGSTFVTYYFYTNSRTYAASYHQSPSGDFDQNYLEDFELMVKNTLRFSS